MKITPLRVDRTGAEFQIALDTHTRELRVDLVRSSQLTVNGAAWPAERWQGDGPGGHHRGGRLRFRPAGSATGSARLRIDGVGTPITEDWTL